MVAKPGQVYDQTYLSADNHGRTVHRDYWAHALRWGHAVQQMRPGMTIVDVGCGPERPFEFAVAYDPFPRVPARLTAIDLNPGPAKGYDLKVRWLETLWSTNALEVDPTSVGPADLVVCFEALEHMPEVEGWLLLRKLRSFLKPDGLLLLSTPAYDGTHHAKNHVNEWAPDDLQTAILGSDLRIDQRFGTFANLTDIRRHLQDHYPCFLPAYQRLREYYSDNVISGIFAPLIPEASRNIIWHLRPAG